jgi:recombination protein RecA
VSEKEDSVRQAIAALEKQYEKGVVFWMTDAPLKIDAIPTGSLSLDRCIGIGGIPRGRISEVVGPESAGKSTLVQHIIAEAQKMGELCVLIDAEHSLDRKYAEACGVQVDKLIVCQPDYGEQGLDVCEALIRSGGVGLVAVDSVAALVPRAELEGEMGDQQMGLQARLMGKALRKLGGVVHSSNTALLFTNQIREAIGKFSPHGTPETTPGGRALKHAASLRMDIRRIEEIKDGKEVIGITSRVRIKKNKCAPPLKECTFDILYGHGIEKIGGVLDIAIETGVVKRGGSWLTFGETRWQGRDAAKLFLRENPELLAGIEAEVRKVA